MKYKKFRQKLELETIIAVIFFIFLIIVLPLWVFFTGWTYNDDCFIKKSVEFCKIDSIRIKWEVDADTNYFKVKCPDKDYVNIYKTNKYSECSIPIINLRKEK